MSYYPITRGTNISNSKTQRIHQQSRRNTRLLTLFCILLICYLCTNNNNYNHHVAVAISTKTEFDEQDEVIDTAHSKSNFNHIPLDYDDYDRDADKNLQIGTRSTMTEEDEHILRDLNNYNFDDVQASTRSSVSGGTREISIEEVMSPEEQKMYMAKIKNLMEERRRKEASSSAAVSSSSSESINANVRKGLVKASHPKDGADNTQNHPLVNEYLDDMSDKDFNLLDALSPQQQLDVAHRILEILPGAKIQGKWIQNTEGTKQPHLISDEDQIKLITETQKVIKEQVELALSHPDFYVDNDDEEDDNHFYQVEEEEEDDYQMIIPAPCVDLYPKRCRMMKNNGHCTKEERSESMKENCPLSCDLCNPKISLEVTGVPQNLLPKRANKKGKDPQTMNSNTFKTNRHLNKRIKNLLHQMIFYYDRGLSQTDENERAVFQMCKNRHPKCAIWAIQGVCETKPETMAVTCGPACRLCHFKPDYGSVYSNMGDSNESFQHNGHSSGDKENNGQILNKKDSQGKDAQQVLSFATSPFIRGDLQGIFEAIEDYRIVRGWNGITVATTSINDKVSPSLRSSWHRFASLKKFTPIVYKADENHIYQAHPVVKPKGGNTYPVHDNGPVIAQFDTFMNEEECRYLLHLVKTLRVSERTDDDGFGAHTTDARIHENGRLHIIRTTSRKYILPYTNDIDSTGNNPTNVQHPIIEQIFDRIELLTGVPRSHVETPLQLDKYIRNQYHEGQPHGVQQTMAEETLKNFPFAKELNLGGKEYKRAGSSTSTTFSFADESKNKNPRILGLTVFLNDDDLSGGDILFPQLPDIRIKPKTGRAVLYPMLSSLDEVGATSDALTTPSSPPSEEKMVTMKMVMEGDEMRDKSWDDVALIAGAAFSSVNADVDQPSITSPSYEENDNVVGSDVTMIAHMKVKSGVKYVISFYLRLNAYLDEE